MIFTGSYRDLGNLRNLGWREEDFVGISRGKFNGVDNYCDELKPWEELLRKYQFCKKNYGGLWLEEAKVEYEKKFKRYLMTLNVDEFGEKLDGKILLCFEKSGDFCHRNFVRQWLNFYGYHCIELWCN